MAAAIQALDASHGELLLHTGVAGRAAKMGHRLTVAMTAWQASVSWTGERPTAAQLDIDVDSFQVLRGEGGLTPLSPPEKSVVRSNALKCLDSRRYPRISFQSTKITATDDGYRVAGDLEIHGRSQPHTVDVRVTEREDSWGLHCESSVRQTEFAVKPYSMLMGSMKVADEVAISFTAEAPKKRSAAG